MTPTRRGELSTGFGDTEMDLCIYFQASEVLSSMKHMLAIAKASRA